MSWYVNDLLSRYIITPIEMMAKQDFEYFMRLPDLAIQYSSTILKK